MPRETVIHDIDDKSCTCCGDERSEKLEFIPAQVKVIEHVCLKYSCRSCEQRGTSTKIQIAQVPANPTPKGIATATLLSQIITSKYQYALPLYRRHRGHFVTVFPFYSVFQVGHVEPEFHGGV